MSRLFTALLLVAAAAAAMALASCAPLLQPVTVQGTAPTPVVVSEGPGEDNPNVFVDTQPFQVALLKALNERDAARLQSWMTAPFLSGWWRGEMMDEPPADALRVLLNERLNAESSLAMVPDADLFTLMGERNPLTIPRPEAGVVSVMLVSGWGQDGRDEMVLFISRQPDNSLKWHGAMLVQGGFTAQKPGGSALPGVRQYVNQGHGYSLFVPNGFEVVQSTANQVTFLGQGEGHRERGFIWVEPANGRTADEVADAVRAEQPEVLNVEPAGVLGIEGEPVYILDRLSGQNLNRQVFVVHNDILYRMMFVPQDPEAGEAYEQMETLYATIINTFHFLPRSGRVPAVPITGLEQFEAQLIRALMERNVDAVRALMGDSFRMAFWQSEGIDVAPAEAAQQMVVRFVAPGATLAFDNNKDFASLFGGEIPVVAAVPAVETVTPVFVSGWGLEGKDEAVLYIAQRMDGSLYWKGILTAQGGFPRPVVEPQPADEIPVTGTEVQYIMAKENVNIRRGPGTDFAALGKLMEGQTAQVTGASPNGGWWRVICPDSTVGNCWISADPALTQPAQAPGS